MRLGTKTVLLTGSLMLALVAVLNAVAGYVVRRSFSDLEKNHVKQDIERVRRAIDTQKEYLSVAVADWTTWDALYRYAEDRNEEFAAENFGIDAFRALKVDLVSLVDPAGVPIWQGFLDVDGSWHSMLPLGLRKLAAPSSPLADLDEKTVSRVGVVMHEGTPMLVAARRILTSAGKGPSHGVLVMGRYLDAAAVDALAQSLRFSIALCGVTATRDTVGSRVMPAGSHDVVTVDTPFSDIDGKPAFALRMTLPRDIYAQGVRTTDVFTMLTVIVGIAFVVLSVFLLRFFVLNRTERLGRGIAEIARSKDFSKRIPAAGNDELTHLAEDVNDLLECVVASRRDLAHAHQEIQDMSQELRKLEQTQFKAVLDEMGDAVLVCDGAWLIREANRAAMALLSLPAARGNAMTHLYEHFDVSVAPEALVAEDATHIRFDVVRPESPGAKALYFEAVMDVIKSPSGASVRRVLVLRDVTISRREEKIKRDFLGLVSHKLRTPVTVIGENAEMLTDASIAGELNDIQRPMVEDIIDQTRVLRSLIEKLLSFAEMGGTHRAMLDDRIELESYLKARAERFLKTMTKERAEIIVACPSDAVLLRTNRMCVDLIIDNLIENAVKFGDKERTVVRLAVSFDIRGIALEVSDNGPGIPPEDIAHVFSAFHQIEKGFTGQVSGVGLGLALVKRLVTACAGSIEMRSELGKGTVFTMVFPSA